MTHLGYPSFASEYVRRGSENSSLLSFTFFIPNSRACLVTPTSQAAQSSPAQQRVGATQRRKSPRKRLGNGQTFRLGSARREMLFNRHSASITSNNAFRLVIEVKYFDTVCGGGSVREARSA
jgi:hypothetical protein